METPSKAPIGTSPTVSPPGPGPWSNLVGLTRVGPRFTLAWPAPAAQLPSTRHSTNLTRPHPSHGTSTYRNLYKISSLYSESTPAMTSLGMKRTEARPDEQMYQFINNKSNTPSSQPSYAPNSTRTGATSGLVNSSSCPHDRFPMLQGELKNLMYKDLPLLLERFIQHHHPDSVSLLPDYIHRT
ncbi:uncharacterized protein PGTG_10791 [Puccinia graminis f. sp. tritici CRL 75-36-700-3]|uniref:Uncharacterized protein n=1 Tax=Puccinia graminis f. sp. tritici (strain CRL 75-36-700-3 / race SCCL) TaxID=418459 RepID=E3KK07_PUCGT|nr:uncharacterized protein PGTG_10791 [Puccinia graminis f. sp. tritici CRL 75-36-700-3]EFP84632.1 hypothetical protein PGTG_10791 [Puccinia graminis f. sp. tritici CRL 75-36-700-3]